MKPIEVELNVNDASLVMELDTGASVSVMDTGASVSVINHRHRGPSIQLHHHLQQFPCVGPQLDFRLN